MLTLRMSVPALGSSEDKHVYESAYALPPASNSSSSASSTESASTSPNVNSQRILNLTRLQSRKQTAQRLSAPDTTKPCLVCWSKACTLWSHYKYASQRKTKASLGPRKMQPPKAQIRLSLPIGNGMLDPFTALPMKGPSREALQLFHDFFTNQASQVHIMPKRLAFDSTYSPLLLQQASWQPSI
jgi:hypothetical protein